MIGKVRTVYVLRTVATVCVFLKTQFESESEFEFECIVTNKTIPTSINSTSSY